MADSVGGIRPERSPAAFVVSGSIHAFVMGWVALGPAMHVPPKPLSVYEREIEPNRNHIIWYNFRERLPEITPADATPARKPLRARLKRDQTIVAGLRDDRRPAQLIWMPAPEIETPRPSPLPNLVALAPQPRPIREFVAPPERRTQAPAEPVLPDAPVVAGIISPQALPLQSPSPRPQPRAFVPPPETRPRTPAPLTLPEAPPAPVAAVNAQPLPFQAANPRPQPRAFVPPAELRTPASAPAALPEAPALAGTVAGRAAAPFQAPIPRPQPRAFNPPAGRAAAPASGTVALAPSVPEIPGGIAGQPAQASLAIVGLDPARTTAIPTPPGTRQSGFSAGPEPRPEGGTSDNGGKAMIVVPGLLARGGAKDAQPTIVAGLPPTTRERLAASVRAIPPPPASANPLARVVEAPDPRLQGRTVYMLSIQMPNVTSYMGSWTVWVAESDPALGGPSPNFQPPLPLRKVDPKYIAAAASDRVEGTVRLAASIRADGRIGSISLIRHLDDRLDRSAEEALAKWEFEPAFLDGRPVAVDAVFEIPFRLAPRTTK